MSSKFALHQAIESLSESECKQLLQLISTRQNFAAPSLIKLAENPTFRIPIHYLPTFSTVNPVIGTGMDASKQLVEDRRWKSINELLIAAEQSGLNIQNPSTTDATDSY